MELVTEPDTYSPNIDDKGNYINMTLNLFFKNLRLFIKGQKLFNQIDKKLGY